MYARIETTQIVEGAETLINEIEARANLAISAALTVAQARAAYEAVTWP
jgi:hypothetical protein